jgi:hypothetical protein
LSYISLSAEAGSPRASTPEITHIPASKIYDSPDVMIVRDMRKPGSPVSISWISQEDLPVLKSVSLSTEGKISQQKVEPRSDELKGDIDPEIGYVGLQDVGLSGRGYFLALLSNDAADLIKWTDAGLRAVFHFERGDMSTRTTSLWGGYAGANAEESWITRIFWSHSLQVRRSR